jgi:hypothetical protein
MIINKGLRYDLLYVRVACNFSYKNKYYLSPKPLIYIYNPQVYLLNPLSPEVIKPTFHTFLRCFDLFLHVLAHLSDIHVPQAHI